MSDDSVECSCVIDCSGLHEIACTKSDNLKSLFLDQLQNGTIAVPACVWNEFRDLYEDEASELEPYIAVKIRTTRRHLVGAASIADGLNSGFSHGAYDRQTDLYTASIASAGQYRVLTSTSQLSVYEGMGCEVSDLGTWADQLGEG